MKTSLNTLARLPIIWKILALLCVLIGGYLYLDMFRELISGSGLFRGDHHDFLAFYTASDFSLNGRVKEVYIETAVTSFQRQIINHPVGSAGYMPFLNPPFVGLLLAPLALLSILQARFVWLAINLGLLCWICWFLTAKLHHKTRILGYGLLLLTFPAYQALIEGQVSILLLFSVCLSVYLYEKKKYFASGLMLSLLIIKPQFAVLAFIGLLAFRMWRIIRSFIVGSLALVVIFLPLTGVQLYFEYYHYITHILNDHFSGGGYAGDTLWHGSLSLSEGINGFFASLVGQSHYGLVNALTLAASAVLIALFIYFLPRANSLKNNGLTTASLVGLGLIINPHLYAQDTLMIYAALLFVRSDKNYLNKVVLVAMLCLFVLVDQKLRLHLFTLTIFGLVCYRLRPGMYNINKEKQ